MSTQLILLPQSFLGVTATASTVELFTDGASFLDLSSSSVFPIGSASPLNALMLSASAFNPNNWIRWYTTGTMAIWLTPASPAQVFGNLRLNTVGDATGKSSGSGVIQKLSSLGIGTSYTIELNIQAAVPPPASPTHSVRIVVYNGSTIIHSHTLPAGFHGVVTTDFTAQSANDIITVSNYDNVNADVTVTYISVKEAETGILGAGNGQVICDLYQEEDIPMTFSVDDFKNVAEQVKSYSKSFNLPATKRNNRIFNNMFDITRSEDNVIFNPYAKTACMLKQDGFIIFQGYLRLTDVKDKDGEISYNVNLYSEVIALAEVLEDRTFSQLDLSELEHDYNFVNIKESWDGTLVLLNPLPAGSFAGATGATTTNVLRYPYIDWNHQFSIDGSGNPVLSSLESAFRPCIKLKYLIDNIFAATEFNYTSSFFDSASFGELFMDFNWGADNFPVNFNNSAHFWYDTGYASAGLLLTGTPQVLTHFTATSPDPSFGYSAGVFTAQGDNQVYVIQAEIPIHNFSSVFAIVYVEVVVNGLTVAGGSITVNNVFTAVFTLTTTITGLTAGDTWHIQASALGTHAYILNTSYSGPIPAYHGWDSLYVTTSAYNFTSATILQTLRGELGQWDFLKGIMTMFNLISMEDESNPNNILIEPYNDIFLINPDTKELNWTDKVDVSQMSLKPLTELNKEVIFKFVEDEDDYIFQAYKNATSGHLYGSRENTYSVSAYGRPTLLTGTKEITAEPFAATVSKALMPGPPYSDFIVPSVYSLNDEGISEGFDNSPRIFYNNGKRTLSNVTYSVPSQGGAAVPAEDQFLQFSHFAEMPNSGGINEMDYVFESQQLFPGLGITPVTNLYTIYWQPYFNELYNANTRIMTLKVNLTSSDMATFKFYDKVFIRNRTFRVNKIDYKPNSLSTVEFILTP